MRPIYLHFLDRELCNSVGYSPSPDYLRWILICISLSIGSKFYCSLSAIFETCSSNEHLLKLATFLMKIGKLDPLSNHPDVSSFIASRTHLYAHDRARYPMYFADFNRKIGSLIPMFKRTSATRDLIDRITARCCVCGSDDNSLMLNQQTIDVVCAGLEKLGEKAITFSAFSKDGTAFRANKSTIRYLISEEYTKHYLACLDGEIITGIRELNYYDKLSLSAPHYDIQLLKAILCISITPDILSRMDNPLLFGLLRDIHSDSYCQFCDRINTFIRALTFFSHFNSTSGLVSHQNCSCLLRCRLKPSADFTKIRENFYSHALINIEAHIMYLKDRFPVFLDSYSQVTACGEQTFSTILIMTATDIEDAVFHDIAKGRGISVPLLIKGDNVAITRLGIFSNYSICWVRTRMGSVGPHSSELNTDEAIRTCKPRFVVSCGIGFGRDSTKQKIGDVLVSTAISAYEKQKIGSDNSFPRAEKILASNKLLQMISRIKHSVSGFSIHEGIVLSGEKLVDNPEFKQNLFNHEPEAIGGEMEGAGIASAATRNKVDWILIKGICDWGENKNMAGVNKDEDQMTAARNAFSVLFKLLSC